MNRFKKIAELKNVKLIPVVALVLLLVIFASNVLKSNNVEAANSSELESNRRKVSEYQTADAQEIELAVDKLDANDKLSASKSAKATYQRLFKKSVVIGDSLTEGLKIYGWLSKNQVYSKVGASVGSSKDMITKAAKKKPKYVFLAFGMNDLIRYRNNSEGFIKEYHNRIKEFKKISPKTEIYICGISAPSEWAISNQRSLGKYRTFNQKIIDMCKAEGYTYIKISDILKNNKNLYAGDGIHTASAYYPHWLNRMRDAAGLTK